MLQLRNDTTYSKYISDGVSGYNFNKHIYLFAFVWVFIWVILHGKFTVRLLDFILGSSWFNVEGIFSKGKKHKIITETRAHDKVLVS